MKNGYRAALAAAPLLFAATAAQADKRDFENCDGLRAPGKGNGGMNGAKSAGMFDGMMSQAAGKEAGLATARACDAALADPRLLPDAALRRSHLLRARALAALQAGDPDRALADLDAAQAAAGPLAGDPLFARSMGVSLTLARAAAWQVKGDGGKARALAAEVAAARPYSVSIQSMAALVATRARAPGTATSANYAALLPLNPAALAVQFSSDMDDGRFAAAATGYPRFPHEYPAPGGAAPMFFFADPMARTLAESVIYGAEAAYAYAATGQADKARALSAEVKTRLEAALVPVVDKKGVTQPESQMATPLRAVLARWTMLTDARLAIAAGRPTEALKPLVGEALPVNAASLDLLTALKAALPEGQRALAPDPAAFAQKVEAERAKQALDIATLRKAMPAPETTRNMADYEKSGGNLLGAFFGGGGARGDGFRSKLDDKAGFTTVEFVGNSSSAPAVEEMTLLRAAELAREAGKPGLLIVGRRDYTRTLNMTQGYSRIPISSTPAGYKTELDVRFVDPAAMPADLAADRDRVLDAGRIYAALAPVYIPPAVPTR